MIAFQAKGPTYSDLPIESTCLERELSGQTLSVACFQSCCTQQDFLGLIFRFVCLVLCPQEGTEIGRLHHVNVFYSEEFTPPDYLRPRNYFLEKCLTQLEFAPKSESSKSVKFCNRY